MVNIYLNNQQISIDEHCFLHEVLVRNRFTEKHIAIALNNQFVPRTLFLSTLLKDGDTIDVIVPMQGG